MGGRWHSGVWRVTLLGAVAAFGCGKAQQDRSDSLSPSGGGADPSGSSPAGRATGTTGGTAGATGADEHLIGGAAGTPGAAAGGAAGSEAVTGGGTVAGAAAGGGTASGGGGGISGVTARGGASGAAGVAGIGQGGIAGESGAPGCRPGRLPEPPTSGVVQVSAGDNHTCALHVEGRVRCWGYGTHGVLGYGNTDTIGDDELPSSAGDVDVGGIAIQISAGGMHTCALLDDGTVRCWGYGNFGQLGQGSTDDVGDDELPSSVSALDFGVPAVRVEAGYMHTCALLADQTVRCWGDNRLGELGLGHTRNVGDRAPASEAPAVDVGGPVSQIAVGKRNSCALLVDGSVRCWGNNAVGSLGLGSTDNVGDDELPSSVPAVPLDGPAHAVSVGSGEVCALLDCGVLRCWGLNRLGALGLGTTDNVGDDELPTDVPPVSVGGPVVRVSCGIEIDQHTCVLLADGGVRCWGWGATGVLGYGNSDVIGDDELPSSVGPVDVGAPVLDIESGGAHTCALVAGGAVKCWGMAARGALGYGDTTSIGNGLTPADVGNVEVF